MVNYFWPAVRRSFSTAGRIIHSSRGLTFNLRVASASQSWLHCVPRLVARRGAKRDGSCIGRECERLIVIAPRDIDSGTGADATFLEKFEQAAVAFVDATHGIVLVCLGVR